MVILTNEELVQKIIENKEKYEYYNEEYNHYYGIFLKRFRNVIFNSAKEKIEIEELVENVVNKVFDDFFKYAEKNKISNVSFIIFQLSWQRSNNMLKSPQYKRLKKELKGEGVKFLVNHYSFTKYREQQRQTDTDEVYSKALQKLPEKYRIILMMKDRSKYKYSKIKEVTDININTLKSRVRRAREMIIYYMKEFKDNDTEN